MASAQAAVEPAPDPSPHPVLDVPQGRFALPHTPQRGRGTLRAWDAADELVLHHLAERSDHAVGRVLVVGDRAGALAIPLAAGGAAVASLSDSWLAHRALAANLIAAGLAVDAVVPLPSTAEGADEGEDRGGSILAALGGPPDLVIVKVPRVTALLEDHLRRIRPALVPDGRPGGATVLGAGMTRHIHTSTLAAFSAVVGPTTTSLARKKARLIHAALDPDLDPGPVPPPARHLVPAGLPAAGLTVVSHAGVFSHGRLDAGTALLLSNLPTPGPGSHAVDLGCGDGVVGLALAATEPTVRLTFLDESHLALASARATMAASLPDRAAAGLDAFVVGDGMDPVPDGTADLVVVNPPFHDDHAQGDQIAWDLFTGARRALRPGGRLVVVGNRHLGHHAKLSRLFGGSRTVASDRRFVVLAATRRAPAA
jgi:23S rRNA (guanine1835-N2)-methyltransferase